LLLGVLILAGAFTVTYALGADLLNFGALIAFMGVNLSALLHGFVRTRSKTFWSLVSPVIGFVVCAYLWWSLGRTAHIVGTIWLATGVIYGAWRTSFFRKPIQFASLDGEDQPAKTQQQDGSL
jgi:hypothetical protein